MNIPLITLENKTILITGGYGHLGEGISKSCALHGANVYVLGRSEKKFNEKFNQTDFPSIFFKNCDISSEQSIKNAIVNIKEKEGKIDSIINNAFFAQGQSPENMDLKDFNNSIEGVLTSVFTCIKAIVAIFKEQKFGKIINVGSMYGSVAPDFTVYDDFPNFLNPPHYGAAKAGIIQLSKYYASYLGKNNIQVNAVSPGPFPSNTVQESQKFIDNLGEKTCLGRIGKPEEIGGIFVFLCSDASNYVTGQNICIDGGWTSK